MPPAHDRQVQPLCLGGRPALVAAPFRPSSRRPPIVGKRWVAHHLGLQLHAKFCPTDQLFQVMGVHVGDRSGLGREVVLPRLARDARLQPALDGVADQILRSVGEPGVEQGLGFGKPQRGQLTKLASIHASLARRPDRRPGRGDELTARDPTDRPGHGLSAAHPTCPNRNGHRCAARGARSSGLCRRAGSRCLS